MGIVRIILLCLLCQTLLGRNPEPLLVNNKRPLYHVAGASDSPNSFPGMFDTTDVKGFVRLNISSMSKEMKTRAAVKRMLTDVDVETIKNELTVLTLSYLSTESKHLTGSEIANTTFISGCLSSFLSELQSIEEREVCHA